MSSSLNEGGYTTFDVPGYTFTGTFSNNTRTTSTLK
jgi:hypothetical protein